jgi:hypothetical protein
MKPKKIKARKMYCGRLDEADASFVVTKEPCFHNDVAVALIDISDEEALVEQVAAELNKYWGHDFQDVTLSYEKQKCRDVLVALGILRKGGGK